MSFGIDIVLDLGVMVHHNSSKLIKLAFQLLYDMKKYEIGLIYAK